MGKHPFLFLAGFAVSYLPTLLFFKNVSANANANNIALASETQIPEPTTDPEPTIAPKKVAVSESTPVPTVKPTPTPAPTPTPDVWSPPDMESIFARYAGQYGVDKNILERLANCESHYNPQAVNGDYLGMFQFSTNTWMVNRQGMGEDSNPELRTDIDASIKTAAYLISQRGTSPWPKCLQ